jgi:site-specific DNA recombinase
MIKNVILYVRVSTDEQANRGFSLRDQEQKLVDYCKINHLNIVSIYREDHSAKTFNRPEFKKMMDFCKKNKNHVDQILFVKWDRFSRNTHESYQKIYEFELLGISVNAIEQSMDTSIPEQKLMLAVYLSIPEVENHRRALNVTAGMRRSLKEGRYIGAAPLGYSNVRDANNKPIIVPSKDAPLVQEAFELMATGIYNQIEVLQKLQKKGLKNSKTPFSNMLKNPIYCGQIRIKAFQKEPEQIVEGIHEPIITKELFNKVQEVITGRRKQHHKLKNKTNEKYPLRGFLVCPVCQKYLTGSTSKGRSQHYSYYHCKGKCVYRVKVEDIENDMIQFYQSVSLKAPFKIALETIIKEELNKQNSINKLSAKHYENKENISLKLQKIFDMYIDGKITEIEYQKSKERYQNLLDELLEKEKEPEDVKSIFSLYQKGLKIFENIDYQYINSDTEGKRLLVGSTFSKKIFLENKKVRTADLNPFISKIVSINKRSQGIKKWDKSEKKDLSHKVTTEGFEPPTLRAEI